MNLNSVASCQGGKIFSDCVLLKQNKIIYLSLVTLPSMTKTKQKTLIRNKFYILLAYMWFSNVYIIKEHVF